MPTLQAVDQLGVPGATVKTVFRVGAVSSGELDDIPIPHRDVPGSDSRDGAVVDTSNRYAGVGYHGSTASTACRLARDVAFTRLLPIGERL